MNLKDIFGGILVINRLEREDRWEHVQSELGRHNISGYQRLEASRPSSTEIVENEMRLASKNFGSHGKNRLAYFQGALGCKMSHYRAVAFAQKNKWESVLILEDDIIIDDHWEIVFDEAVKQLIGKTWELFYLGGNHRKPQKPVHTELSQSTHTDTTHAYAIHSRAYSFMLMNSMRSGLEIDNFYVKWIQPRQQSYCVNPFVMHQRNDYSDIRSAYRQREPEKEDK